MKELDPQQDVVLRRLRQCMPVTSSTFSDAEAGKTSEHRGAKQGPDGPAIPARPRPKKALRTQPMMAPKLCRGGVPMLMWQEAKPRTSFVGGKRLSQEPHLLIL